VPFTVEQFFDVFRRYNHAVWPAPVILYALALVALVLTARGSRTADRGVAAILAFLWLWMGVVYHLGFFRAINPAAIVFGAVFVVEGLLFLWAGVVQNRLGFGRRSSWDLLAAAVLLLYALFVYPTWLRLAGHDVMASPTFGAPCPTTIFTFGVLFAVRRSFPKYLLFIPLLWAAIGSFAAFRLGVPQDYGLLAAGLLGLFLFHHPESPIACPQSPLTSKD